jgi:hypothetical protein
VSQARYDACLILAIAASATGGETLREIATAARRGNKAYQIARAALLASLEAGNWRQQRAEAESKLRSGWAR